MNIKKLGISLLASTMILGSSMTAFASEQDGIEDGWWEPFEDFKSYPYTDEGLSILKNGNDGNTLTIYVYAQTDSMTLMNNKTLISFGYYQTADLSTLKNYDSPVTIFFELNPFNYHAIDTLEHGDVWAIQVGIPDGYYELARGTTTTHIHTGGARWNLLDKNNDYELSESPYLYSDDGEFCYDHDRIVTVTQDFVEYAVYGMSDWINDYSSEFTEWAKEDAAKRVKDENGNRIVKTEDTEETTVAEIIETPEETKETVESLESTEESEESITIVEESVETTDVETTSSMPTGMIICLAVAIVALLGIIGVVVTMKKRS